MDDVREWAAASPADRGPDPRVVRSRQAALNAARDLLAEQGRTGVTHVAVAARSGVGRTTLYRHWPDVAALLEEVIVEQIDRNHAAPTGDLRTDLISELNGLRRLLHDPVGENGMRAVLDRAPFDPAFADLKEALYQAGSAGFRAILRGAQERGDLPAGTDVSLMIEQLAGPLFFRRLLGGRDIGARYVDTVVDDALRLHAGRGRGDTAG
ncbi:TetR/AcrR family transcriptional regulator [Nocardia spumae]|uniref:TetR/AcrR family transcriptional regulator n=1 Tax=Nocardia spumae TaxID=2887190 RepID=UPI001D13358A|nr:TetR/AcrR family transcriptional regulator [Nocardia spumae]